MRAEHRFLAARFSACRQSRPQLTARALKELTAHSGSSGNPRQVDCGIHAARQPLGAIGGGQLRHLTSNMSIDEVEREVANRPAQGL